MKNKANFKMGKIGVTSFMTSEYEGFWAFLLVLAAKNKANLEYTTDARHRIIAI